MTSQATNVEIETFIKKWLRYAPDRDGGRSVRMNKVADTSKKTVGRHASRSRNGVGRPRRLVESCEMQSPPTVHDDETDLSSSQSSSPCHSDGARGRVRNCVNRPSDRNCSEKRGPVLSDSNRERSRSPLSNRHPYSDATPRCVARNREYDRFRCHSLANQRVGRCEAVSPN